MQRYRIAMPVLALVALAACSADKAIRPSSWTTARTTVRFPDLTGAWHQYTAPPQRARTLVARAARIGTAHATGQHITADLVTGTDQLTDSAGNVWTFTMTASADVPPGTTVLVVNDTGVTTSTLTWTPTADGYYLAAIQDSISSPGLVALGGTVYDPPPLMTMTGPWSQRLLAFGRGAATSFGAFVGPQRCEAATACWSQFRTLIATAVAAWAAYYAARANPNAGSIHLRLVPRQPSPTHCGRSSPVTGRIS